ncbi:hypothetical protein G6M26_30690 [Agrobacterium tumefaciens]|nr:hypothetical protein [Agrobacterium tumefaciens]NTE22919.1 hypothetical protein [Agrobacterium tumefaciens]
MKTKLFFMLFLLTGFFSYAQNKTIFPESIFDKNLAKDMLALGTSTIEGVASTKQYSDSKKQFAPEGTLVTLYPLTPYFEEFLKLRRRKENKKTSVYISDEAYKYRLETKTDANGRFKLEKLKPGKYYIECIVPYTATYDYSQQTGTTTTYNGYGSAIASSPYYETFHSNYASSNRETKIVEIKEEGQLLEIKVGYTLKPFKH